MTTTYESIATTTTSGSATTVTFNSIPSTYTDLIIIYQGGLSVFDYVFGRFNGDTGNNYSGTAIYGNGSIAASHRYTSTGYFQLIGWGIGQGSALTTVGLIHIMNYANTTVDKSVVVRDTNPESGGGTQLGSHLWRGTAAITSITLTGINSRTYTNGSTFSLYGIKSE